MKYEDESMSTFQKTMKNVMEKSNEIPQFNMSIDISMKEILKTKNEFNKRYKDTKITITPLLVKIVAELLKKYRLLNTKIINDDKIRYFKNINIGVAFATNRGLIVPVFKNIEGKNILQISQEIDELKKTKETGTIDLEKLKDGTFTISNAGMYGVNNFNALINPPQVGILAVGKIRDKVKLASENIKKEKYAIFTITCDHRIIDGRYAARFLGDLKVIIENPKKII